MGDFLQTQLLRDFAWELFQGIKGSSLTQTHSHVSVYAIHYKNNVSYVVYSHL